MNNLMVIKGHRRDTSALNHMVINGHKGSLNNHMVVRGHKTNTNINNHMIIKITQEGHKRF